MPGGPTRLDWVDPARLLDQPTASVTTADVVGGRRVPARTQGALWASLGGGRRGLWSAQSDTRCGVLTSPTGRRFGFLPGAEGLALAPDGDLWAVSESGAALFQREGGRPLVPTLVRLEVGAIDRWSSPACRP